MKEAQRKTHVRLYELGEYFPPVKLQPPTEKAVPKALPASIRERTEALPGARLACGAVFLSDAAKRALAASGLTVDEVLREHVYGEPNWTSQVDQVAKMNRSSVGAGEVDQMEGPVLTFHQLPPPAASPNNPGAPGIWIAVYTHSERTFTCVATQIEAPYARLQIKRPPRLGC